jgi:hypothetical protein
MVGIYVYNIHFIIYKLKGETPRDTQKLFTNVLVILIALILPC